MSFLSSSSSKQKSSKSSSASRHQSSWEASDKSSLKGKRQLAAEWSDWAWSAEWQQEWRSCQLDDGSWEYQYRIPEVDHAVPRAVEDSDVSDDDKNYQYRPTQLSSSNQYGSALPPDSFGNVSTSGFPVSNAAKEKPCPPVTPLTSHDEFEPHLGDSEIQLNTVGPEFIHFEEEEYYDSSIPVLPREPTGYSHHPASRSPGQRNDLPLGMHSHEIGFLENNLQQGFAPFSGSQYSPIRADHEYTLRTKPEGYFKLGRMFSTFSAEHEKRPTEPLIFVVLQEGKGFSVCCALKESPKVDIGGEHENQNWALVFAAGSSPQLLPGEEPLGMIEFPVMIEWPASTIRPTLRLDFNRAYTIRHDVKVRNIGRIDRNFLKRLKVAFLRAMGAELSEEGNQPTGFAEEDGIEDEVEMTEEPVYGMVMVPQVATPTLKSIAAPSSPDNIIRSHSTFDTSPKDVTLHGSFKIHQARDFEFGRLFKILWTEPKGQGRSPKGTEIVSTKFGEDSYASIRRFVIVRSYQGHCLCLPILTYNRQGTSKPGVIANNHAIIYTKMKGQRGQSVKGMPREEKLSKKPIRVQPLTHRDQLDPSSRVNYAKIYTVEYNVKVCFIGKIHSESVKYFIRDYNALHQPLPEEESFDYSDDNEV